MFDHISLRTHQLDVMTTFYEQALAPLGIKKLMAFEGGQGLGAMRLCCRLAAPSESARVAQGQASAMSVFSPSSAASSIGARPCGRSGGVEAMVTRP
jgi:hypothetical protein